MYRFLVVLWSCAWWCVALAAEVWVAQTGDDTQGVGTQAQPWATLERALASHTAGGTTTIHLGPGTWITAAGTIALPSGLTLQGAGQDQTLLIAEFTAMGTAAVDDRVYTTQNPVVGITIQDLTLAGALDDDAPRRGRALVARDGTDLILQRVNITRYQDGAVRLERWQRARLDTCVITKTTYNTYFTNRETPATQSTAIEIGDVRDVQILWVDIDTRERGGRGIGGVKQLWEEVWDDYNWEGTGLVNLEIGHCSIQVDPSHAWDVNGYHPAQMTIEFWNCYPDRVRIHHCYLNNNLSLQSWPYNRFGNPWPPYGNADQPHAAETIRMDHNILDLDPGQYAIEHGVVRLQFHHNIVYGGYSPLAYFVNGDLPDSSIHHNLFVATGPKWGILLTQMRMVGMRVVANTFVYDRLQEEDLAVLANGETDDQVVANNLFLSTVPQTRGIGFTQGLQRNWFWNFATVGDVAGTGEPQVQRLPTSLGTSVADIDPADFIPAPGSALIDAGVVVAPQTDGFVGAAPDLGAFEVGRPWFAGPNRDPVVTMPAALAGTPGTSIALEARVEDDGRPRGGTLRQQWSAPAEAGAVFADATAATTAVTFATPGTWNLTLTVDDGDAVVVQVATVVVTPVPVPDPPVTDSPATGTPAPATTQGDGGCGLGSGWLLLGSLVAAGWHRRRGRAHAP